MGRMAVSLLLCSTSNDADFPVRYLFLIEGLVTLAVGIVAAFYLPASPTETKGWLRGKEGWFTEREETIIVTRVLVRPIVVCRLHVLNRRVEGRSDQVRHEQPRGHWIDGLVPISYRLRRTSSLSPLVLVLMS